MADALRISGSLRNRLVMTLIGGAAILAALLFIVVRTYAAQIAQQGQDSIIGASVTSILDAAVIRDGIVDVDFPYASLSMLGTASDDRVFYAIFQDDTLLSGYDGLPRSDSADGATAYRTVNFNGTPVRLATAARTLIGTDLRVRISVSVAQTRKCALRHA